MYGIVTSASGVDVRIEDSGYIETGNDVENLELIAPLKTTNNMASLIDQAKLAFKSEPEKSFIKIGVMDSNENLTPDGKELLLQYLLEMNKDDFKTTIVDPILAADEKAK